MLELGRLVITLALFALVVSCANQQPAIDKEAQINQQAREFHAKALRICNEVDHDPRIRTIRENGVAIAVNEIEIRHLANQSYVTPSEQNEILLYEELMKSCRNMKKKYYQMFLPNLLSVYENYDLLWQKLLTNLYMSNITYGKYVELWQELVVEHNRLHYSFQD